MMGGLSPMHWLIILTALSGLALPILPLWRILDRKGLPGPFSLI